MYYSPFITVWARMGSKDDDDSRVRNIQQVRKHVL